METPAQSPRKGNRLRILLPVLALGSLVCVFAPRDWHDSICFHCRAEHEEGTWAGIPYRRVHAIDFTDWYLVRRPLHEHQWLHIGHRRGTLLGATAESAVGGSLRAVNPMWIVTVEEQRDFLERSTREEAERLETLLLEHRQPEAVNLILAKASPPRTLCDNFNGGDGCGSAVECSRATEVWVGARILIFCSPACRDAPSRTWRR